MKKSKPFAAESEHFHSGRIEGPLPEKFKEALQSVQKAKECKNKVPLVEINEGGRYYLLIPRQRLAAIAGRYFKTLPTPEEMLLGMSKRQSVRGR